MKRFLCLALALCLVLGLCGCQFITKEIIERNVTGSDDGAGEDIAPEDDAGDGAAAGDMALCEHGIELAKLMEEMLDSGRYIQLMGGSDEVKAVLEPYSGADLSEPESVYRITPSDDTILVLMGTEGDGLDGFSGHMQDHLRHMAISALPATINSQSGVSVLSAASICSTSDVWAGETLEDDCYLLYFYQDACPLIVTFHGGENYVSGSAMLLPGDNVAGDSMEDVASLFDQLGIDCDVDEVDRSSWS